MTTYCKILENIINNYEEFNITALSVKKLDHFLREKVSFIERRNISPLKFSLLMEEDQRNTLRLFAQTTKLGLFEPHILFQCHCNENKIINNHTEEYFCEECEDIINPNLNRDRIYVYFKLNYEPLECTSINNSSYESYADVLDDILGKPSVSLSDFDKEIGTNSTDDFMMSKRTEDFKKLIDEL